MEFLTPRPMTYLSFSLSLLTRGEKSESPEAMQSSRCAPSGTTCPWRRRRGGIRAESSAHGLLGHLDQLDRGLMEAAAGILPVAAPVGIGAFGEDLALFDQSLDDEVDVEAAVVGVTNTDGDVLEVDEERDALFFGCACGQVFPAVSGFAGAWGVWAAASGSQGGSLFEGAPRSSLECSRPQVMRSGGATRTFVSEAAVARAVRDRETDGGSGLAGRQIEDRPACKPIRMRRFLIQ